MKFSSDEARYTREYKSNAIMARYFQHMFKVYREKAIKRKRET